MKRLVLGLAACMVMMGCEEGGEAKPTASATASAKPPPAPEPEPSAEPEASAEAKEEAGDAGDASDESSPKGSIAAQIELLKKGDHAALAKWFTARQRAKVTKDVVEKAQGQASMMSVNELVDSVEMGESKGKKTAKVKMKNGRTLTTLIQEGDKWLADTIWFK